MTPACRRILRSLDKHQTFPIFTDGDMGRDLCKIASDGCAKSLKREVDAAGNSLAKLSEAWVKRKGHNTIGVWLGLMSDPIQMAGELDINDSHASVTYGVSQDARDEAAWFIQGDPPKRPGRPFWGLTTGSVEGSVEKSDAYLTKRLKSKMK